MAAISIGSSASASGAAAASSNASRTRNFDSVMSGVGHAPREADAPSHDDADTRVAEKDDKDDADRKEAKVARAKQAGEDPAALLALASSVAAATRRDAATADAAKADTANAAVAAAALTSAAPAPAADAAKAEPAPAESQANSIALAAMFPGAAQAPQSPGAKPSAKGTLGLTTTSTADILAARTAKIAPVDAASGDGSGAADADAGGGNSPQSSDPTLAITTAPAISSIAPATTIAATTTTAAPTGGEALAVGGADRQLDLAKGDAWLDGLARDIASSADSSGKLSFQLSPPALGNLQVELTRGDDGTAVKMTTATVDAQTILADAKPRLIEQARAYGVHISDATVDLGSAGTATTGGQHRDPSGDPSGNGTSSGQSGAGSAGTGGDANRQAQSQAQSEPDLYHTARRPGTIASATTGGSRRDLDAGYA